MVIIRCTQKVLSRLHVTVAKELPAASNILGAWYANSFVVDRRPYVIFMNERSFVSVVLPLKESATLTERWQSATVDLLISLAVPKPAIRREVAEMSTVAFGCTESRSLVGNLNELVRAAEYRMMMYPDRDLMEVDFYLSDYLIGPAPYRNPRTLILELLGGAA
jgi:hypothetical protein